MNGVSEPLVSIIVNCYNSDTFLKETLQSIIDQTYQNWEVIFWDNQSIDKSKEYFESYNEPRFKYYYAPTFEPLSTARNLAVEKASGKFLAFVDCDDVWISEKLSIQVPFFSDAEVGLVYSDFDLIIQSDSTSANQMAESFSKIICKEHPRKNIYKKLLKSNFIIFSTILLRRTIFELAGGFTPAFKHNEDYEILLKVSLYADAVCVKARTTKYRIHGGNNSYDNEFAAYRENYLIFSSMPQSSAVKSAININNARALVAQKLHRKKISVKLDMKLILGFIGLIKRKIRSTVFQHKAVR